MKKYTGPANKFLLHISTVKKSTSLANELLLHADIHLPPLDKRYSPIIIYDMWA